MPTHPLIPPADDRVPKLSIWGLVPHIIGILVFTYLAYLYFASEASTAVNAFAVQMEKDYDTTWLSPAIRAVFPILFGGSIPLAWLVWLALTKIMRDPVPPQEHTDWIDRGKNRT